MNSKERPTLGPTKRILQAPLDPAAFADAVVQIYLDNAGDLELIAKSIESSDLNFNRYGDTFFEVVFTGGRTQPGTTKPDEGERHPYSIIDCEPSEKSSCHLWSIYKRFYVRPFLIKVLKMLCEDSFNHWSSLRKMKGRNWLFSQHLHSQKLSGLPPETVIVLSFVTDFFKEYLVDNSLDDLISILKRVKWKTIFWTSSHLQSDLLRASLSILRKGGLIPLVEYNEKKIFEVKLKEMKSVLTTQIAEEADISEVIDSVKQHLFCILWDVLMDAVQWSGKNQQQNANAALRQVKTWAELLNTFCTNGKLQLELLYKVQMQCYEDAKLMKLFPEVVRSLYDQDVLAEDTILYWFRKGTNPKGRQTFVKSLEAFVKWLEEAEEEE
ncbi:hypothetical protein K2173_013032 [Erythroxylum novogranatense]|uniref:W2 domain-containing protein n=1 Tax=Erythroxylum novogranatense TaxID=1862640 RepID=A0AAV8S6S1_9ROSI|nr:hypothetical protein K2173_013032 [Erythroxylum novogranatense]